VALPPAIDRALRQHQDAFERATRGKNLESLKRVYEAAIERVIAKIASEVASGYSDSFTAHTQRIALLQLREGIAAAMVAVEKEVRASASASAEAGSDALIRSIAALDEHFRGAGSAVPVEEVARLAGLTGPKGTLLRVHDSSFRRYGARLVSSMETELAVSLASGESLSAAIRRIEGVAQIEWWRAERIGRTESSHAFNAAHDAGIERARAILPDLNKRWTEHVDDETGRPLDDRVADDSLALHGQVAGDGGMFEMPADPRVSAKLHGKRWAFPPNRPNDRARILPWRPHWGELPGWVLKGGRRVPVSSEEGKDRLDLRSAGVSAEVEAEPSRPVRVKNAVRAAVRAVRAAAAGTARLRSDQGKTRPSGASGRVRLRG